MKIWKTHAASCDIIVGEHLKKLKFKKNHNTESADLFELTNAEGKLIEKNPNNIFKKTTNASMYIKKSPLTYQLVKEWKNSDDKSISSLKRLFNNNPHYKNGLRTDILEKRFIRHKSK